MTTKSRKRGTGCIEDFRCPKCGNYEGFRIEVIKFIDVESDGIDEPGQDNEWDDKSWARCNECDHEATVGYFTNKEST